MRTVNLLVTGHKIAYCSVCVSLYISIRPRSSCAFSAYMPLKMVAVFFLLRRVGYKHKILSQITRVAIFSLAHRIHYCGVSSLHLGVCVGLCVHHELQQNPNRYDLHMYLFIRGAFRTRGLRGIGRFGWVVCQRERERERGRPRAHMWERVKCLHTHTRREAQRAIVMLYRNVICYIVRRLQFRQTISRN